MIGVFKNKTNYSKTFHGVFDVQYVSDLILRTTLIV